MDLTGLKYRPEYGDYYYYVSHCIGCEPSVLKRQFLDSFDEIK
ncbi:MAG: hypothetical protein RR832_05825 [Bacilli bacterium]